MASHKAELIKSDYPPYSPPSSSRGIIVEDVFGGHSISTGCHDMADCILDTTDVMEDSDCKNTS